MDWFLQDLRHGVRVMIPAPSFTLVTRLVLALGMGGNTAIFSVMDALLLRPPAVRDPGDLVWVRGTTLEGRSGPVSYLDYLDCRQTPVFSGMVAYVAAPV